MKVILCQDIENLGKYGEIIEVKEGYARNYLLPKKFAFPATAQNLKKVEQKKLLEQKLKEKAKNDASQLLEELNKKSITVKVKVGESKKMFGVVTAQDISDELEKQGITIDKKDILLEEPIRELGVYNVDVKLHPEVVGKIKVWVVEE